jgi:hypothetical protein
MTTLALALNGLPIYNVDGQPLFQAGGEIADAAGIAAIINPKNGLPQDGNGNDIQQSPFLTRINALVAHKSTTAAATALAAASTLNAPPSGVAFVRAPGRLTCDMIDYSTKHGDAIYKRAKNRCIVTRKKSTL